MLSMIRAVAVDLPKRGWSILLLPGDGWNSMLGRLWPAMLVLVVSVVSGASTSAKPPRSSTLKQRERQVSRTLTRAAQYADVPHISSRPACEDVQPPQALTTPDPLFTPTVNG